MLVSIKSLCFLKLCAFWPLLFSLTTIANAGEASEPPISIPFNPQHIGETYISDAKVTEQLTYAVKVYFYLTLPSEWTHFFDDQPNPEEAKRLSDILGGARKAESGEWVEPGVPAAFRVHITRSENQEVILDELIKSPKTGASYMGRYAVLATKSLPVGLYSISIQYVSGAPELAPLRAKISFARAHHGK